MSDNSHLQWSAVDEYFAALFIKPDAALTSALHSSAEAELPDINVAPNQGKLLQLLVSMCGAKRVLEVGTLGGYSAIWMARALPFGGQVVTLELDPRHAEVARMNFRNAGLDKITTLRQGAALDSLQQLIDEKAEPFDLVFIDADKANIPEYFQLSLKLTRAGSVIIVDNVVRKGEVINPHSIDPSVIGVRQFNDLVAAEPRVSATALQTVGAKGYDGLVIMQVVDPNLRAK